MQENLNERFYSNLGLSRQASLSQTPWMTGIPTYCSALVVVLRVMYASKVGDEVVIDNSNIDQYLAKAKDFPADGYIYSPYDQKLFDELLAQK